MKKLLSSLVSTSFAGLYIIGFAIAIGVATFIENDYGTDAAQKLVYQAWWFELLLFMFSLTLVVNMLKFNLFRKEKVAVLLFHLSIIIIFIGAGVTRYYGYEGMMHIREGKASSELISSETYIDIEAEFNGVQSYESKKVRFAGIGKNRFHYRSKINDREYDIVLKQFHPSAVKALAEVEDGKGESILSIVSGGASGRVKHFLKKGEELSINGYNYSFRNNDDLSTDDSTTVIIVEQDEELLIQAPVQFGYTTMATQVTDTLPADTLAALYYNRLYNFDEHLVVFTGFQKMLRLYR